MLGREGLELSDYRKKIGKPSQQEIAAYTEKVFQPLREDALKIKNQMDEMRPYLTQLYEWHTSTHRRNPARPTLIGHALLSTIHDQYQAQASNSFTRQDIPSFRFFYDIESGMTYSIGTIFQIEVELRGEVDNTYKGFLDYMSNEGIEQSDSDNVNQYLKLRNNGQVAVDLLKKDPSGFTLVDFIVESEDLPLNINLEGCPEYKKIGRELTRDLYKLIYPMTSHLYS